MHNTRFVLTGVLQKISTVFNESRCQVSRLDKVTIPSKTISYNITNIYYF